MDIKRLQQLVNQIEAKKTAIGGAQEAVIRANAVLDGLYADIAALQDEFKKITSPYTK